MSKVVCIYPKDESTDFFCLCTSFYVTKDVMDGIKIQWEMKMKFINYLKMLIMLFF